MPTGTGLSAAAAGDESTSAGVKRRWAREAVGFGGAGGQGGGGGDADVIEVHATDESSGRDGMDVEPMADLEGWDGIGERPPKRTMRSARGGVTAAESSSGSRATDVSPPNEP